MFDDLRQFISKVQELGECKVVEGADWDLEIGTLTDIEAEMPNPAMLLFDNIKDHRVGFRVVSNLFSNQRRTALGLGLPSEAKGLELVKAFRDKLRGDLKLVPPVEVDSGPVKENILTGEDIDLFRFPAPRWHELDGGRYIGTGSMVIMRDSDWGWVNLGCYRIQVHDKTTLSNYITPGHHGFMIRKKYWDKGKACPVAISLGQEPLLWFSSLSSVPWGVSEYDYAGGLRNRPVSVTRGVFTDLPIPATAEIVLEGEIVPESKPEGPFGEWTGYYASGVRPEPVIRVKSILHRNNPILQGNPPMVVSPTGLGTQIQKAAYLWDDLDKQVPGVKGVWQIAQAGSHNILVIALRQQYDGHAKQAAVFAAGHRSAGYVTRYIIVVDDDIDPSNLSEVLWALGTRSDPGAVDILRGCWNSPLDPLLTPERRVRGDLGHALAIILACKPYNRLKEFPATSKASPELMRKTRKKWGELFPEGTI